MVVQVIAGACREFDDLLQRHRDEASDTQLQIALKELAQSDAPWEGLDESQLASAASLLLGQDGLFELAQKQCQDKEQVRVACRRYALEATARFLHLHGTSSTAILQRRCSSIVSGCMHVCRRDVSNQVAVAGLTVLLRVLEVPGGPPVPGDLGDDLLRELKMKHGKLTAGHRSCILRILATLADRLFASPTSSRAPFTSELPQRLLSTLHHEVNAEKPVFETLTGALDAVDVLLRRHVAVFKRDELQRLYDYVFVIALTADAGSSRLGPQKAALRVLQCHAGLFRSFYISHALQTLDAAAKPGAPVLEEGGRGQLLDALLRVSSSANNEVAQAGRTTLDAVLRAVSDGISWEGTVKDVEMVDAMDVKQNPDVSFKSEDIEMTELKGAPVKRPLDGKAAMKAAGIAEVGHARSEPPREAAVVRRWCAHFRAMVQRVETDDSPGASLRKNVLIGVRSLGALAPAALRLDGGVVALDFLEVILDALHAALTAPDNTDADEQGTPADRIANAMPEYAEALAHVVPVVQQWLTSSQWARILAAGGQLLSNFSQAFTKQRPAFARSFADLASALLPTKGKAAKSYENSRGGADATEESMLDVLVAQGLVLTVTQDTNLQTLWELVLLHLESEGKTEVEQQLIDSIVTNVLALARQGVDCHLLLQRQEERTAQQMADHVAKVRARGSLFSMGRATATSPLSIGPEIMNAVAEDDPNFTLHTGYIYNQASQTVDLLNQIAAIFDRCFGKTVPAKRVTFLKMWFDTIVLAVAHLVVLGQNAGSPPPGIFRLLRATLTCCCHTEAGTLSKLSDGINKILPNLLEDIAGTVEGYQGAVAAEALEALLAVRPEWVNPERWLPVFRRALTDGLHDLSIAKYALQELERWRDASVVVDWTALLPAFVPYLQIRDSGEAGRGKAHAKMSNAERRARRALPAKEAEDRTTFLRQLFRFVGSLGGDCHAMVASEPSAEELQRPTASLSLRVPFVMGGAQIELEPALLLPHLAQLVKKSTRRNVRLAAAEGLHAIVRLVIGSDSVRTAEASTGEDVEALPTDFADALRNPLLPLALRAAVDDDASLAQIFRALLGQIVAWFSHCPATASLSSLRDSLLEAMKDPQNPSLRSTAGRYYAELLSLHSAKPAGTGAVVAKRLLQHLLAAASHVDGCTQLGALQALLWCVLAWEADTKSTDAVVETLKVVVHCLHTSNSDRTGLSTAAVALQLGRRLVRSLVKVDAPYARATGDLVLDLWRNSSSPDATTRAFCREALVQLAPLQALRAKPSDALEAASGRLKESVAWDRLEACHSSGKTSGATVVAHSLELLAAQLDTVLWLSVPGGGESLIKSKIDDSKCSELAQRAVETFTLVPWSGSRINRAALEQVLEQYAPQDSERVMRGRMSVLLALVSFARLSNWPLSTRMTDVLLTLVLAPSTLLASNASWKSKAARRYMMHAAVEAIHRTNPTGHALQSVLTSWIERHVDMDISSFAGRDPGVSAFEACFRQWPEHKRGDLRGVAERMEAFVDGIEKLWQHSIANSSSLWDVFFKRWPGGVEAMVADWRQSVSWHSLERKSEASQQLTQALMRFLLVAVPSASGDSGMQAVLPEAGGERAVIDALLCMRRPPKDAIPQLLIFFARHARLAFDLMRPWTASRKRDFLRWLSDFSVFARESGSEKRPPNQQALQKKPKLDKPKPEDGWDHEDADGEIVLMNSIIKGSVLAQVEGTKPGSAALTQQQCALQLPAVAFAKLFAELPRWHEWAVSDAAHGGADDEDAPAMPPDAKRSKTEEMKAGAVSRRVRQSRADRTGLYQLATLLHSSATVEAVLDEVALNPDLCQFLVGVLRSALGSENSSPRIKTHFLTAIPTLLLKSEVHARERTCAEAPYERVPAALEEAAAAAATCVREMVLSYFPLRSRDYSRDSEEYSTYLILLNGLFRALELSAPSVRLLPALYGTLREKGHREEHRLRGFVGRFVRHLAGVATADDVHHKKSLGAGNSSGNEGMLAGSFTAILGLFLDEGLDDRAEENVRFALMEKLGLPLLMELTQTAEGCVAAWVAYWPRLLELANTKVVLGKLLLGDSHTLHLKIMGLTCIFGAIEILFMRATSDILRERIAPRLPDTQNGQQSSPSRDLIPLAKSALERPPGWEHLDRNVLRRYHLRVYAALSAAICATQAKQDLYHGFLFKEDRLKDLVEPWAERSIDLSALSPNTDFASFSRSGYAFAFRASAASRGRWRQPHATSTVMNGEGGSLLGTDLWGATQASLPGTFTVGGDLSLQTNVLRRAVINKAVQSLNVATPGQQKVLAATVARDTQGATTIGGLEDTWSVPPPGAEGNALRLQGALRGLRAPVDAADESQNAQEAGNIKWRLEWVEHDAHLFPGGPSTDCNLSLLLTLLRTFDVMVLRFGIDSPSGRSWLLDLFTAAERPTADFWFRLIFIRLLVLRSEVLKTFLYGQEPRFFRFIVGFMLDSRFGAEKRFHYLFRDVLQSLIVPQLGATDAVEGDAVAVRAPSAECAYDAERLLHHLQKLAPHNETYWQRAHVQLIRLYIMHYASSSPSRALEPDRKVLSLQLTATSQHASVLQHNALRQLAIFLECGGFNPFLDAPDADVLWRAGLLACVGSKDSNIAAYSCSVVGLLAKWHPVQAMDLVEETCRQIYECKDKADAVNARRMLMCLDQLLQQCPWALCELPSSAPAAGSSARRKLFNLLLSRLPTVQAPNAVRPLLASCTSMCRDCAAASSSTAAVGGAAPGAWAMPGGGDAAYGEVAGLLGQQAQRTPPSPPGGEELRRLQREQRSQLLLAMRSGDVWRNTLSSTDAAIRKAAANLVHMVAPAMDEETLLSCVGLMLESVENLRERQTLDVDQFDGFMKEVLAVCLVVCDRRSDVARGEVAPGILSFLVHATTYSSQGELQEKVQAFWEAQLSGEAAPRLAELCNMASSLEDVEQVFIPAALQMLLPLARKSAEYRDRRRLVRKPLAECEFKPMQLVDASSWNATQGLRTFQPAASYASVFREIMTQSASQVARRTPGSIMSRRHDTHDNSVTGTLAPGAVPSQMVSKRLQKAMSPSADADSVQLVRAAPTLLRRSDKDARHASIRYHERQTRAALASIESRDDGVKDAVNVQLTCNYRVGDFPDVEVSVEDIIEPLMRAGLGDAALGEELLLAIWTGITSGNGSTSVSGGPAAVSGAALSISVRSSTTLLRTTSGSESSHVLQSALTALLENGGTDSLYVHFLHRLVMRCSQDGGSWIPLPALQRSINTSLLSGVQALEELLPSSSTARSIDGGRHRVLLSALYEAYAALGEQPSMEAAVVQLNHINSFSNEDTLKALQYLQNGKVEESVTSSKKVLEEDIALPAWELRMASRCHESALEALMSWDQLEGLLHQSHERGEETATSDVLSLRTNLGLSVMHAQADAQSFLDSKLQHSQGERAISARGAALLATHAASRDRRDDAQRLLFQGYDAFVNAWRRIPHLAGRAKHELLSSLPLLHTIESASLERQRRALSVQHDSFAAWTDSMLAKVVVANVRDDRTLAATTYMEIAHRCRKAGNFATADMLLRRCLGSGTRKFYAQFAEVIKLKLDQGKQQNHVLLSVVEKEAAKHPVPADAFSYALLSAKVAIRGWEHDEAQYPVVRGCFRTALSLADHCGSEQQIIAYSKLAEFADSRLRQAEQAAEASPGEQLYLESSNQELAIAVVESVLKVLQIGGSGATAGKTGKAFSAAHQRLPRVFELLAAAPQLRTEQSARLMEAMPTWLMLRWLPQALAHLPNVSILLSPLKALARSYPQALIWPLQLSSQHDASESRSQLFKPLWLELQQCQAPVQLALTFTKALECLIHPDQRFSGELRLIADALKRNDWAAGKAQWRKMWNKCLNLDTNLAGHLHVDFVKRARHEIQSHSQKYGIACSPDLTDRDFGPAKRDFWLKFISALDLWSKNQSKHGMGRKEQVEQFSTWLKRFDARAEWQGSMDDWLEMPGQYSGLEPPNPQSHIRILRFTPHIMVMPSKQRPKRLIVLGSDEREHWFLVKGGEDLRLDARIEQLFESINGIIAPAAVPGLRIRTVAVVPLLPDLGIIAWATETRTLKSLVLEMSGAKELREIEAHKQRVQWANQWAAGLPPHQQTLAKYQKICTLPSAEVEVAFKRCTGHLPPEATLRAFLWRVALGPEALWHLRQRFAASLAVTSIASYILGIGDRHLDNFLFHVRSAELVPIDFGYSFGIGAMLPVPELVPFRLTGFICSVLQPLAGEHIHGPFRDGITTVLSRCRRNHGVLKDACAIFLREPLLDWAADARRKGEEVDFMPRKRLRFLSHRLQGRHPAKILNEELKDNPNGWVKKMMQTLSAFQVCECPASASANLHCPHCGMPRPTFMEAVIAGLGDKSREINYKIQGMLTPEQQADCLIRQATDAAVLGRAWEGWAPEL